MTDASPAALPFALRGDHITLEALLKASPLAPGGSNPRALIADGQAQVNGETETRRGRKLRAGDRVVVGPVAVQVQAA